MANQKILEAYIEILQLIDRNAALDRYQEKNLFENQKIWVLMKVYLNISESVSLSIKQNLY